MFLHPPQEVNAILEIHQTLIFSELISVHFLPGFRTPEKGLQKSFVHSATLMD